MPRRRGWNSKLHVELCVDFRFFPTKVFVFHHHRLFQSNVFSVGMSEKQNKQKEKNKQTSKQTNKQANKQTKTMKKPMEYSSFSPFFRANHLHLLRGREGALKDTNRIIAHLFLFQLGPKLPFKGNFRNNISEAYNNNYMA